jgi:hypothetical protein
LLLYHFFLSINIGTKTQTDQTLYKIHKRRTQVDSHLLTFLSIFGLPWLTFTFRKNALFFPSRSNGMKTDIGSRIQGFTKNMDKASQNFIFVLSHSVVDSVAIAPSKDTLPYPTPYHWLFWHRWPAFPFFTP